MMSKMGSCRLCCATINQCAKACIALLNSIASAQITCKQKTFTEHGKASLHCQPFAILQFVEKN
jgi:hypothetical protein